MSSLLSRRKQSTERPVPLRRRVNHPKLDIETAWVRLEDPKAKMLADAFAGRSDRGQPAGASGLDAEHRDVPGRRPSAERGRQPACSHHESACPKIRIPAIHTVSDKSDCDSLLAAWRQFGPSQPMILDAETLLSDRGRSCPERQRRLVIASPLVPPMFQRRVS
jgi:hypothetical protein